MSTAKRRTKTPRSRSSSESDESDDSPFTLSQADQIKLLQTHKPSSLPASSTSPLLFLSPEELIALAARDGRGKEGEEDEDDDDEVELWEELANDILWTIPFAFLFSGMDYAVHAQYGQRLLFKAELGRLLNVLPTLYLLTFLTSRPRSRAFVRPRIQQTILLLLSIACGVTLIHITATEGYLKVMRQAPALGTLWVWSIVRMDLIPALLALFSVAVAVYARGEGEAVIWWH